MTINVTGAPVTATTPVSPQDSQSTDNRADRLNPGQSARAPAAAEPDVQVDTRLPAQAASERSLTQEASDVGNGRQQRQDLVAELRAERDRLSEGNSQPDNRQALEDATQRALEQGRAGEDSTLAAVFTDDPLTSRDNLDSAISALEQRDSTDQSRLDTLTQNFNELRDQRLSPGNTPIESSQQAREQADQAVSQLRDAAPASLSGITQSERDTVLNALQ